MNTIEAIAYALPARALDNQELKRDFPDWDFDRLEQRVGVLRRYVAADGETALDFVLRACQELAERDSLKPEQIDAVIFCTQSPDFVMPPNSALLHGRLNLRPETLAFDINLACSGYVYGLLLADSLLRSGAATRVLLATADTYTRFIHPSDRSTRCLFGDGGAVTIVSASKNGRGFRQIRCGTAGKHFDKFIIPAGGMRRPRSAETAREVTDQSGNVRTAEHIHMDGFGVLSFFNATVPHAVAHALASDGLSISDVDVFIFHQASKLALDILRKTLDIPESKMICDLADGGNLVSASIPVALRRALQTGNARPGQLALLCGFGVGLSWGTALVDL